MSEPDWEKLKAIGAEMERLRDAGKWTKKSFDELVELARAASGGHGDAYEFLILNADPSWL